MTADCYPDYEIKHKSSMKKFPFEQKVPIWWGCKPTYCKNPNNSDTEIIVVIILKFEQHGFTIEKCVLKM